MLNVSDIVEANGKTVKQNNMAQVHNISIGTLVEILPDSFSDDDDNDEAGLRLFVVGHGRDCDGTPLYHMSFKKDAYKEMEEHKRKKAVLTDNNEYQIEKHLFTLAQGSILFNYSESSLKVIK